MSGAVSQYACASCGVDPTKRTGFGAVAAKTRTWFEGESTPDGKPRCWACWGDWKPDHWSKRERPTIYEAPGGVTINNVETPYSVMQSDGVEQVIGQAKEAVRTGDMSAFKSNGNWCSCADEGASHPSDCHCACHVEVPVLLTQPIRTVTITGIAEPKRDITPDGKWAHGSPENCGDPTCPDCEHKPRGGFEFL